MKKVPLPLVIFVMYLSSATYGQNDYYWSGGKKMKLQVDSSKIILSARTISDLKNIKEKVLLRDDVIDITELSLGVFKSFEIKINKNSFREIYKDVSNFPETVFSLPYYLVDETPYYFTNEIILKPKNSNSIDQILSMGASQLTIKERTQYNTYLIEINNAENLFKVANHIYESGLVEWCHPNFRTELFKSYTPTDPMYLDQYYLNNTGQLGGIGAIDINAPEAWDITRGCNDVRVVVIDDGVEVHDDLAGRVLAGFTPVTGQNGAPVVAGASHGQACSGIIAATHNNGIGVSGVAPNSQIIPVNIFAGGETANDIAAGINWAWNPAQGNADVISNSWSYNTTAVVADVIRQAIEDARTNGRVRGGVTLGCTVVFSSGNWNQTFAGVAFPGNVQGVITVGAIDNRGALWNYSSRGPELELVAPSGDVNLNGNVRTTDRMGGNGWEVGNYTNRFGGTSAACPQVAGVAALMISANPNLTEVQVRTILQQTATDMGATGFDNNFGFGRVNAQAALNRVLADQGLAVTGPGFICSSAPYSVNFPAGSFITWQTSSNVSVPPKSIGHSVTATKTGGNGPGYVQATRNLNGCGVSVRRQVQVGPEYANFSVSAYPYCAGPGEVVDFTAEIQNVNYSWTVNGGTLMGGQGTRFMYAQMGSGTMAVHCSVSGTSAANCYSPQGTSSIYINQCWGFSSVNTSPNPASTSFDIELSEEIDDTEFVEIELRNDQGTLVKSGTGQGGNFKIDVQNLKNGPYILKVKYRDQVLTHRVLIEN